MNFAPTSIDLSRIPAPDAIKPLSDAARMAEFITRFLYFWNELRATNPSLPQYDVETLNTDPAIIAGKAWSFLRTLDQGRVNDAVRAVLAPLAKRTDLDNVAASANVQRLIVVPARPEEGTAAVMEGDESLLRRYLLAFDRPSAGSSGRFLYEAWTAWPQMGHAAVVGRAVHGRRGDTDVVVTGPGGRLPTPSELTLVRAAVLSPNVQPEAIAVNVLSALRRTYSVDLVIEVPPGPDAYLVADEAKARVLVATADRTLIGAEVPAGYVPGAAYGPSIIKVRDLSPVEIPSNAYTVPVCISINVVAEVRA